MKPVVIKKYENRRLYDTTNSSYVNLKEVAQMVQEGKEIQVLDAATGEDLTRLVLTQIIVEHAKEPGSAFPLDVLRQMVVATGRASQETALNYMKTFVDLYQNAYRAMPSPLNPFGFIPTPAVPRSAAAEAPSSFQVSETGRESRGTQQGTDAAEVGELKRRVEELESLIIRRGPKKSARRRRTRSGRRP
jgi:polyhydroxyalkanoate synthesis repressor PhaR